MNIKKSVGYDDIPCKFLKIGATPLAGILCQMVNISLNECNFPDMLKFAEIAALLKKLDRLVKENYRPVSILTAISKVFERVFGNQLSTFFDQIFSKFLYSFRQRYSCQTSLLRMIEDWKSELDNGFIIRTVAIDLSKAFDSLPHGLLIAKLHAYGVDLSSCKLLASYLHNRHQRVKIKDIRSDWLIMDRGVPQGSILGPLLFNVFNNDINIYNYADDNCISYVDKNVLQIKIILEKETNKMMDWFAKNSLAANPTKFQTMLMCGNNKKVDDLNIIVENTKLESTSSIKVLGVNIDSKLNFNDHVCDMCTKAGRQLNLLQRLKGSLDFDSRMVIYKSFIISNFNHCPVVWLFTSKSSLSNLENIQKRALRFVLNDYESDYNDLLTKANVPGIKIVTLRQLAIEVYKSVTKINPEYLNELFLPKQCTYNLRNVSVLERPKVNTIQFGLKSFKIMALKYGIYFPIPIKKTYLWVILKMSLNHGMAPIVSAQYAIFTPKMSISSKKFGQCVTKTLVDLLCLDSFLGFNVKDRSIYRLLCFLTLSIS